MQRIVDDDSGTNSFIEGTFVDITERKSAEERVQSLAYFDALTGLPNRDSSAGSIITSARPCSPKKEQSGAVFPRPRPIQEHQ
jgi:predicted signal transduction protein with EAL and GGDEF domain